MTTIDTSELSEFYDENAMRKLVSYARKNHRLLSNTGSSRIVFLYKDDTVLKIAKNKKGLAQNDAERQNYEHAEDKGMHGILCPIIDYDDMYDSKWIVARRADKVSSEDFVGTFGIPFGKLRKVISYMGLKSKQRSARDWRGLGKQILGDKVDQMDLFTTSNDNPFQQLWFAINELDLSWGDAERISSWGIVDGRCVFIDYGGTEGVIYQHYTLPRMKQGIQYL